VALAGLFLNARVILVSAVTIVQRDNAHTTIPMLMFRTARTRHISTPNVQEREYVIKSRDFVIVSLDTKEALAAEQAV
jgi:hypothetical protein